MKQFKSSWSCEKIHTKKPNYILIQCNLINWTPSLPNLKGEDLKFLYIHPWWITSTFVEIQYNVFHWIQSRLQASPIRMCFTTLETKQCKHYKFHQYSVWILNKRPMGHIAHLSNTCSYENTFWILIYISFPFAPSDSQEPWF
jgi:hypothetical protein